MKRITGLLVALLICPLPAFPDDAGSARVAVGVGEIDLREDNTTASQLVIEGKPRAKLWNVRPVLVALYGGKSSYYAGAGLLKEFRLSDRWQCGIGLAAGRYQQGDSERDLGNALEFQSRLAIDYQLLERQKVRLEISHLSNARLSNNNPGTELVTLNWVFEFD